MKTFIVAVLALAAGPMAWAQEDPGPSPTNSYGCSPHHDHWHCEGPRTDAPAAPTSNAPAVQTSSKVLPPSPANSINCSPHVDHWHCEGPRTSSAAGSSAAGSSSAAAPSITSAPASGSASKVLPASPTASTNCSPHVDHWHCEGPATGVRSSSAASGSPSITQRPTSAASSAASGTASAPATFSGVAGSVRPEGAAFLVVAAVAAFYA